MKLVILHSNIENDKEFVASFQENCIVRKVNEYSCINDLIQSLYNEDVNERTKQGDKYITHLAFIYHNYMSNTMTKDTIYYNKLPFYESNDTIYKQTYNRDYSYFSNNVLDLIEILSKPMIEHREKLQVDIVTSGSEYNPILEEEIYDIENKMNIIIHYSNTQLGNGNWRMNILDRHGEKSYEIEFGSLYFTEKIYSWKNIL